ncbi:MAG: hypothetical protein LUH82_01185 [Clostridiales bacterium]|nr:hypothetical protein [Clostridiales bacterium]
MKRTLGFIALSAAILAVGFLAMSLPFHLFSELTPGQMRGLWIFEFVAYFLIVGICLSAAEKRYIKRKSAARKNKAEKESAAVKGEQNYDAAA